MAPVAIPCLSPACLVLALPITLGCKAAVPPAGAEPGAGPPFRVGLVTLRFEDGTRHRPLVTRVWYPADAGAEEQDGALDGIFSSRAAANAPLSSAPETFPLVLLSHGTGGGGSNMVWFAENLARHGYLAAAVDHFGDTFGDSSAEGVVAVWRRPVDLSRVLDALMADARFGRRIAADRIGAAGFSSGGYTVIALAGAVYRPELMAAFCKDHSDARTCELPGREPPQPSDQNQASNSYRDPRIRAVFAMAPALGPGFDAAGLAPVRVPVQIVASSHDEVVPFDSSAQHYAALIAGARLTALNSGGHFIFMPLCNAMGLRVARAVCADVDPSVDRKGVHDRVGDLAVQFFDQHLRSLPSN
jgi:predicted dienelactone hydrolase